MLSLYLYLFNFPPKTWCLVQFRQCAKCTRRLSPRINIIIKALMLIQQHFTLGAEQAEYVLTIIPLYSGGHPPAFWGYTLCVWI
jgi:hypothetical protein